MRSPILRVFLAFVPPSLVCVLMSAARQVKKRPATSACPPPKKRPASSSLHSEPQPQLETTTTPFSLTTIIGQLLGKAGLAKTSATNQFFLASGCSGAGTPTFVARALLGKRQVVELYGCERSASKAHFFINHCRPGCCFSEMKDMEAGEGACLVHNGALCKVPMQRPDSLWIGFSCKANSTQNPARFTSDNVKASGPWFAQARARSWVPGPGQGWT